MRTPIIYLLSMCLGAGLSSCITDDRSNCPPDLVPPDSYTVTFIPGNGQPSTTQEVADNALVDRPADPVWAGHSFLGWFLTTDRTLPWDFDNDRVTSDITLYGQWSAIPVYTVTFDSQGGSDVPGQIIPEGEFANEPDEPIRDGYIFDSWNALPDGSGVAWNFESTPVTEDVTLYAQWKQIFTVSFAANGGAPVPPQQSVVEGGLAIDPGPIERDEFVFDSWNTLPDGSGVAWDFGSNTVNEDVTLYAQWRQIFAISFVANGGVPVPPVQYIVNGGLVSEPDPMQRDGYVFNAWYIAWDGSGNAWDFNSNTVTGNIILYAIWDVVPVFYTVTFDTNGGFPTPASQSVISGGTVTRPADPIRENYAFIAWYPTPDLTGLPWSFATGTVNSDMTLYARWLDPAR